MYKNRQLLIVSMCFMLIGWLAPALNAQGPVADGLVDDGQELEVLLHLSARCGDLRVEPLLG